jgi:predicted dehydrogenase
VVSAFRRPWLQLLLSGLARHQAGSNTLLLQKGSHDIDMIHWLTGQYTKRVAAFGSLDFFGGDKPNDLTCDVCDEP